MMGKACWPIAARRGTHVPHYTDGLACVELILRAVEDDLDAQDFIAVLVVIWGNVHVSDPGIAENLLQDCLDDLLRRLILHHGDNPAGSALCGPCGRPIHRFGAAASLTLLLAIASVNIHLLGITRA